MTSILKATVAALALAIAATATAQYSEPPPPPPPPDMQLVQPEVHKHVARVNVGVGFYNSGWYNCDYYYGYYTSCSSGSYTSYVPFLIGGQLDFGLSRTGALSLGFTYNTGSVSFSYYNVGGTYISGSKDVAIWEPTVDYVIRFGPMTSETLSRMRVGGAMYIGPNGGIGGAFRLGGGASFLNTSRLGIGLDVVLEAGGYQGYWIGGLQLLVSPEFRF